MVARRAALQLRGGGQRDGAVLGRPVPPQGHVVVVVDLGEHLEGVDELVHHAAVGVLVSGPRGACSVSASSSHVIASS